MASFVDGSLAIIGIFWLPDSYYRYLIMYPALLCLSFLISFNISGCDNNMSGFCRGRFGPWCHHILKLRRQKVLSSVSVLSHKCLQTETQLQEYKKSRQCSLRSYSDPALLIDPILGNM